MENKNTTTMVTDINEIKNIVDQCIPLANKIFHARVLTENDDLENESKEFREANKMRDNFIKAMDNNPESLDFTLAFRHILYKLLIKNKVNPFSFINIKFKDNGEDSFYIAVVNDLREYIQFSLSHAKELAKLDEHEQFAKEIEKSSNTNKPEMTAESFIDNLLTIINKFTDCCGSDATEIANNTGIDVRVLIPALENILKLSSEKKISDAKKAVRSLFNDLKISLNDLMDAVSKELIDTIDEPRKKKSLSMDDMKSQVEDIMISAGCTDIQFSPAYLKEEDGPDKDKLTRVTAKIDNTELVFWLDVGAYCNPIPKVFIFDIGTDENGNRKESIAFAVTLNELEKLINKLKNSSISDLITDKDIHKVVTQDYLMLSHYGLDLSDKIVINNYKKFYMLAKSTEWYVFACTYTDHDISAEMYTNGVLIIKNSKMPLFSITNDKGEKITVRFLPKSKAQNSITTTNSSNNIPPVLDNDNNSYIDVLEGAIYK